jgi:hypothetical protein
VADLTPAQLSIVLAGILCAAAYFAFILAPAWASYGRLWERVAASFLTLFILATLIGIGTAIGFAIVWFYDTYA